MILFAEQIYRHRRREQMYGYDRGGMNRKIRIDTHTPLILRLRKWKSLRSVWLFVTPMDYTVHRILQARIQEWVAFPFSRASFQPRDWTQVSRIAGGVLPAEPQGKPKNTSVGSLSLLQWIFMTQESNLVSCIAGGFLTSWATRETHQV